MIRASAIVRHDDIATGGVADTIKLEREARFRRRVAMKSDSGRAFLLDLPEATYLAHGDALLLDDGTLIGVRAAAEDLLEIHVTDARMLATVAWHIGNRHTPAEITEQAIYIQPDHVLAEMVAGLGAHVHAVRRPFEPEGGAYGAKGALVSGHSHDHGDHHHDDHQHDHLHAHSHDPAGS